ncbi:neural cell adhesion molecule 1 [Cololabis saira]|uniref:neural cell adhesion molecule 1 n=1 Tax=Cololabis saira TaxID=129043 RepID=UPI002AD34FF5|nr:neural cell adhesion molecule 1 [Cololabis saira]
MLNLLALVLRAALLLHLLMRSTDAKMEIISSKQDFQVGEEILLLCKAGGEGDIMWRKDGNDIEDEEIVVKVDEATSKLIIKKATMGDTGQYTCHCDFDAGHQDHISTSVFVYDGPSFGDNTNYHEFLEGTDGHVPCLATGKPRVDVKWYRHKEEIASNGMRIHTMSDNTLSIEKVTRKDAGTYVCRASIPGRPVSKELPVSIVVNVPPTVHLKEQVKKVIAGPQTNVTLLCLVEGIPTPTINWTTPAVFDTSRYQFNSDLSELTIQSVVREDYGEYICTARNKIGEDTSVIMLHVFVAPEVSVSADQKRASVGERVLVTCNVSGHPQPELHWLNKQNGLKLDSTSGRVRVVDGVLEIDEIVPSDGGLYSCMAVSSSRNASRDVAIYTQPGPPHYLNVSPGPASVLFSLKTLPVSGGMPITHFLLQWKKNEAEQWNETVVQVSDSLAISSLQPYTTYTVRLAALNDMGKGQFSDAKSVKTRGIGEPDKPDLLTGEMKVEDNSFSVPLKQTDEGGSTLLHYKLRFRKNEESEWTEMTLPPEATSVDLKDLSFASGYQLEISAVNANGSSMPATFDFTIAEMPVSLTKGTVVGIVMLIFIVVFLVVDATCCYRNRCGLLMTIAVKLFGQKVPGLKMMEDGDGTAKGEVKMKGISTAGDSLQQSGCQTAGKEAGQLSEVTCDKASLTKNEKMQLPLADA